MADFARYLPLSARPPQDETGVSSHWGADIAAVLDAVADLLVVQPPTALETPSLHPGWSVRDVAGYLSWRLAVPTAELVRATSLALVENGFSQRRVAESFARRGADLPVAEIVAGLRSIAVDKRADRGRTGIRELAITVVGGLDIARPLGAVLPLRPAASGAVALRRALNGPTEIKAVIRDRSLTATDADWSFGRGPAMSDTAEAILLFLYERSDRAPGSAV
ncbi:hypothetical protein [Leifsonia sp. Leaf264]|uniref:hypothetical protein n=1 Tax=Leifsonia sp. Leaf264 TaxID=1736314 RepID=UPI0006FC384C|nr:hypothetical protein [Leifsonia sp. Leaf264]KQO99592.1 hypothetical protein ASF30_06660 [Leifsonia sp. Leaf264]